MFANASLTHNPISPTAFSSNWALAAKASIALCTGARCVGSLVISRRNCCMGYIPAAIFTLILQAVMFGKPLLPARHGGLALIGLFIISIAKVEIRHPAQAVDRVHPHGR